jgi:uncharacterized protein YeeX (DUF496 family)
MKKVKTDMTLEEKIKDFSDLLHQIDGVTDKKKRLWKEIYENAVTDRQNAYVLFTTLVEMVQDKSTEHAIHGKTMATYIERMSRANDQIIKLAELVSKSEEKQEEEIDPEEMFKKIGS